MSTPQRERRERRRTRNGEGIRTAGGWSWLCDHCHHVMHMGVGEDVQLDVDHLLQAMDDAHWCWRKGRHTDGGGLELS